jgi:hypothetical protein
MESNPYTRWSKSSCIPNDSQDDLDKVQHDYMRRLNRRHELITGRCFGELIWRSSEETIVALVELML